MTVETGVSGKEMSALPPLIHALINARQKLRIGFVEQNQLADMAITVDQLVDRVQNELYPVVTRHAELVARELERPPEKVAFIPGAEKRYAPASRERVESHGEIDNTLERLGLVNWETATARRADAAFLLGGLGVESGLVNAGSIDLHLFKPERILSANRKYPLRKVVGGAVGLGRISKEGLDLNNRLRLKYAKTGVLERRFLPVYLG